MTARVCSISLLSLPIASDGHGATPALSEAIQPRPAQGHEPRVGPTVPREHAATVAVRWAKTPIDVIVEPDGHFTGLLQREVVPRQRRQGRLLDLLEQLAPRVRQALESGARCAVPTAD